MTKTTAAILSILSLPLLCGCSRADQPGASADPGAPSSPSAPGLNRDDFSETQADRNVSQMVKSSLANDGSLSSSARDISISTVDGVVTARGEVASEAERQATLAKIKSAAGVKGIEDQVLVKAAR